MTTKKAEKTKRAVAAKSKVTTGAKRAVKRTRVAMVKTTTPAVETTPVAPALKVEANEMEALVSPPAPAPASVPSIQKHELEKMIRLAAFKRAQARHFRGGSPTQDWLAAEAAVKAELHSRGVQLPN